MCTIKIIIADDHALMRAGLVKFITEQPGMCVVAEAADGEELLQKALTTEADVIITDLLMPKMKGEDVIKIVKEKKPQVACIALSLLPEPSIITRVMENGARTYCLKSGEPRQLLEAIHQVVQGAIFYCDETWAILRRYKKEMQSRRNFGRLTEKEEEILRLTFEEYTVKEIAAKLGNTTHTIASYCKTIKQKIGAKSIAGMVRYAIENFIYFLKR